MATKTVVTFECDGCGKTQQVEDGAEPTEMLEFEAKQVRPKPKSKRSVLLHFHKECVPAGMKVLLTP